MDLAKALQKASREYSKPMLLFLFPSVTQLKIYRQRSIDTEWLPLGLKLNHCHVKLSLEEAIYYKESMMAVILYTNEIRILVLFL